MQENVTVPAGHCGTTLCAICVQEFISNTGDGDRTSRLTVAQSNPLDNYTLRKKGSETVLDQEMYIEPALNGVPIKKTLRLERGSAFAVCMAPTLKGGSIQFFPAPEEAPAVNVVSLRDSTEMKGAKIGGLKPGKWIIKYVDQNDSVVRREELDLVVGRVMDTRCGSAISSARP